MIQISKRALRAVDFPTSTKNAVPWSYLALAKLILAGYHSSSSASLQCGNMHFSCGFTVSKLLSISFYLIDSWEPTGIVDSFCTNLIAKQGPNFPIINSFGMFWCYETTLVSGIQNQSTAGRKWCHNQVKSGRNNCFNDWFPQKLCNRA